MSKTIYLDSAASTQIDPRVKQDIIKSIDNDWMNPSSVYEGGREVRRRIEHARDQVRELIGANKEDKIIFTSCSTESNNLAVQGFIKSHSPKRTYIFYDWLQHPSLENIKTFIDKYNEDLNCVWHPIFNDEYGRIKLSSLKTYFDLIKKDEPKENWVKVLVPVIYTNNETGVINNVKDISELVHSYGGYVLADCAQAIYHHSINVHREGIDIMTFTSEKIGMPRGAGVLYIRDGIDIEPIMYGGSQENNIRPGTENTQMIIALGNQCKRIKNELEDNINREYKILYLMENAIKNACDGICKYEINGRSYNGKDYVKISPNILSVQFYCNDNGYKGYNNQELLTLLDQYSVCCSAGSACSSHKSEPSRILTSIGLTEEQANSTLRFSFDHTLKEEDITEFGKILRKCLIALKQN